MPDKQEARLLAEFVECQRVSSAASSALTHPIRRVVYLSEAHQELLETNAEAQVKLACARASLRAYRTVQKSKDV